ncbi:hypothetical protein NPIL_911 [Nephila pilipes]|uniref:Uncharacterized protein n=1 Tax=Nephila pilipes TaxID=299642 RepID=A0A8X6MLC2_NEPPI|nr:hypothetical protein NPIL_911 [Nephila pilipes]
MSSGGPRELTSWRKVASVGLTIGTGSESGLFSDEMVRIQGWKNAVVAAARLISGFNGICAIISSRFEAGDGSVQKEGGS